MKNINFGIFNNDVFLISGFSGYVAFIVGGQNSTDVEVFSVDGRCNYKLAPLPFDNSNISSPWITGYPPMIYYSMSTKITACMSSSCWSYNITTDSWSLAYTLNVTVAMQQSIVYSSKLYIPDMYSPQVNVAAVDLVKCILLLFFADDLPVQDSDTGMYAFIKQEQAFALWLSNAA
jgi:hypothetical protein